LHRFQVPLTADEESSFRLEDEDERVPDLVPQVEYKAAVTAAVNSMARVVERSNGRPFSHHCDL